MCDRSGPDTGAALCLEAIGQQDTYLLGGDTPFKYTPKRHSNFRKFHRNYVIHKPRTASDGWPFNETIKYTLDPRSMGDLLCNMYIKIDLPALSNGRTYADQIGRHLFKSITLKADEVELEKYFDDWGLIHDELYNDLSEKRSSIYYINRGLNNGYSLNTNGVIVSTYKSSVYIPIPFFFSRKYESDDYETNQPKRPYFPLCAINKQKLLLEFEFRPQSFFTDETSPLTLENFNLVTEEITLEPYERAFITNNKQTMITDVFRKHPSTDTVVGENILRHQLVPKKRVKTIHWFLRNKKYENEDETRGSGSSIEEYTFQNRFNLTKRPSYNRFIDSLSDDVMTNAKLYINGEDLPNVSSVDNIYYKNVVTFFSRLSTSTKNIYSYTFSMNPRNVDPSGSLDFSQLKSNRTILEMELDKDLTDEYTLNMYYTCYETFVFENGYVSSQVDNLNSLNDEGGMNTDPENCRIIY